MPLLLACAGAVLWSWAGKYYLIAHANNSKAAFNEGFDLYAAETDAALEHARPLGKFFDHTQVSPDKNCPLTAHRYYAPSPCR